MKKKIIPAGKIINFIKYHNAFSVAVSLVFLSLGAVFASSPQMREDLAASLISANETVRSIDNTYIASIDLANFNFGLQITDIKEDDDSYYISYAFKTIYIRDYIWQDLSKEAILTVSKQALADKDLGLYVAEELSEVINYQLSYLKEVQQIEKQKGLSQKVVATEYAGLIGKFLNPKEEVFPGYSPVVSPLIVAQESPAPASSPAPETLVVAASPSPAVQPMLDRDFVRQIVEELLAQERQSSLSETNLSTESPVVSVPSESPSPTPEPSVSPEPTPTLESSTEPSAVPSPIVSETPSPTPEPTESPNPLPEASATPEPSPMPSESPSPTPEVTPAAAE